MLDRTLGVFKLGCGGAMLGLLAGAAAQAQPAGIRFEETVRLVEVPVWVLGSGGEPVTDLAAAEFSLKEDGKDQEIAFFELLDYDRTTPQTLRFPRQYLFLFDTMFSEPFAIIRARRAAIDFLDRAWGPNDVAAVAMVTAREGVKLVCNFTSDRRVLGAALETLGYAGWTSDVRGPSSFALLTQSPAGGGRTTTGERGGREELSELRDGIDQDIADHIRQQEGQAQIADFRRYKQFAGELFSTLDRLGTGLRAMQGVKHVVYFSQGVEERVLGTQSLDSFAADAEAMMRAGSSADAAADAFAARNQGEASFGDAGLRGFLTKSLERMASNSVLIHPVDIGGLRGDSNEAVDESRGGGRGLNFLTLLAGETGGQLYKNSNDITGALEQLSASTRALYLLAYYPKQFGNEGKYHQLQVKVDRKGLDVSARPGYYEDKPFAQYSALERQFHLANAIVKSDLFNTAFTPLSFAAAFPRADGQIRIPVLVEIPLDRFTPDPKGVLHLEAYGFLLDDNGQFHDYFERLLTLPAAELRQNQVQSVKLLEEFIREPGAGYQVRVVARDSFGGAVGSSTVAVPAPDFEREFALSTPVFRTGGGSSAPLWRMPGYRAEGSGPESAGDELPEQLRGGAADPSPVPELKVGETAEIAFRVYNLSLHPETQRPQITMGFVCRDHHSGAEVKVTEITMTGPPPQIKPGCFDLSLRFKLPELPPGEWDFVASLTDTLADRSASASAPIRVAVSQAAAK
ncbi:MAG TPA: VWA domain-containing protein [Acidobacteriota bacterium]